MGNAQSGPGQGQQAQQWQAQPGGALGVRWFGGAFGKTRYLRAGPSVTGWYKQRKCAQALKEVFTDPRGSALYRIYGVPPTAAALSQYPQYTAQDARADLQACAAGRPPPRSAKVPRYHKIAQSDEELRRFALRKFHGLTAPAAVQRAMQRYTGDMARSNIRAYHGGKRTGPRFSITADGQVFYVKERPGGGADWHMFAPGEGYKTRHRYTLGGVPTYSKLSSHVDAARKAGGYYSVPGSAAAAGAGAPRKSASPGAPRKSSSSASASASAFASASASASAPGGAGSAGKTAAMAAAFNASKHSPARNALHSPAVLMKNGHLMNTAQRRRNSQ